MREALRKETSCLGSTYESWVRELDSVKLLRLDDGSLVLLDEAFTGAQLWRVE